MCVGRRWPGGPNTLTWPLPQSLGHKVKYYSLHQAAVRQEVAWVDFRTRGVCKDEGLAVLFPPYSNDISIFVRHPDAVDVRGAWGHAGAWADTDRRRTATRRRCTWRTRWAGR